MKDLESRLRKHNERMISELMTKSLFGGSDNSTATCSCTADEPLTLDKVKAMVELIKSTPKLPPVPKIAMLPLPTKQAKTHKKKRINKKWYKKYGRVPDNSFDDGMAYVFTDQFSGLKTVAAYPQTYRGIQDVYFKRSPFGG